MRILVADDDRGVSSFVETVLIQHGYAVVLAVDGQEAVERFTSTSIDAVLVDVEMPSRDGFSALAAMRSLRSDLPAIVMSGADNGVRARAMNAAFLEKPFTARQLVAVIERTFGKSDT